MGIWDYFNSENFMPHGHCFLWLSEILWLHVISDGVIAAAYYSIPASLLYFVGRRADIPFKNLFYLFGAFILLCGTTHILAIWVIWHPDYAVEGVVKGITACVSALTAVASWKIIPKALELKSPQELERVNAELKRAYEDVEGRVEARTAELVAVNEQLQKSENELQIALVTAQEASTAKSDFLANMSHEIRTPMNAIMGLASILAISSPLTPKQQEFIRTLQLSTNSLLSLINDLLDIAKIESHSIELELIPFYVPQLLADIISMMSIPAKEKGIVISSSINCERAEDHAFIGDPARLRQVLLNLCSNAVKFTEHGHIKVTASCEPTEKENTENLILKVEDTGIGIASDKLDVIFSKFVQADSSINRKYGGTGLGLAITKSLTEFMGGTITAESRIGEGSVFILCIPLERMPEGTTQGSSRKLAAEEKQHAKPSETPILLVEDYPANILVATTFLEQFGYHYDVSATGAEALERFKENRNYLAILMDVQMPGMNGYDVTRHIREFEKQSGGRRVPIIGMTANALFGDRERCLNAGMDDYIAKPFNPDELKEMLKRHIEPLKLRTI